MAPSLSSLSHPRPPTPPKDMARNIDEALSFLDTSLPSLTDDKPSEDELPKRSNLDTPPPSSPTSSGTAGQPGKRLRFSAETSICESVVKPLPPSRYQKSSKSILKPFEPSLCSDTSTPDRSSPLPRPHRFATLGAMLESIVKQLGGSDSASKYDAYLTLSGSIKAYKEHPESQELLAKLPLLEQFLKRDIAAPVASATAPDKKLKIQALQLTAILLWRLQQHHPFSHEFLSFLLDHSIRVLGDPAAPKEIVRHHLNVLNEEEVYAKAMNADRTTQLLKCLIQVGENFSGNSINHLRLRIYRRLVLHSPVQVAEDASKFLPLVFHGMMSSDSELRCRAMETAFAVGSSIGQRKRVCHAVATLLGIHSTEQPIYLNHIQARLSTMLQSSEDSMHAPQIWGLVMFLARGDAKLVEQLLSRLDWLKVIEKCFNSGNTGLNLHAWAAWDRTIFAASQSVGVKESIMKRLCQPIFGHLQRRTSSGVTSAVKRVAYGSLYTVLYYTFGQSPNGGKTEVCWKSIIHEGCSKVLAANPNDADLIVPVLRALLGDSNLKIWKQERALDTMKNPLTPDDIPRLDPQWLRKNIDVVLPTVELFYDHQRHPLDQDSSMVLLWTKLMKAVSQAGEKEIKASIDLKNAIAGIVNSLGRLSQIDLQSTSSADSMEDAFARSLGYLTKSAVEILGPIHFADHFLRSSAGGFFEASTTPTKQGPPQSGVSCSPASAICYILSKPAPKANVPLSLRAEVQRILRPCLKARPNVSSRVELLRDCATFLPINHANAKQRSAAALSWQGIAELTASTLEQGIPTSSTPAEYQRCDFETVIDIFEYGLQFSDPKSLQTSRLQFACLRRCVKDNGGKIAYITVVAERIAKIFQDERTRCSTTAALHCLSTLLQATLSLANEMNQEILPVTSLEARKMLFNTYASGWPKALYTALNECLLSTYKRLETVDSSAMSTLLMSLKTFLGPFNALLHTSAPGPQNFLLNINSGIMLWVEDRDQQIARHDLRGYDLRKEIFRVWEGILNLVSTFLALDDTEWEQFAQLLCAGFRCRNRTIVDKTLATWNGTCGTRDHLNCSPLLENLLSRLKNHVDIFLPALSIVEPLEQNEPLVCNDLHADDANLFPWLSPQERRSIDDVRHDRRSRPSTSELAKVPEIPENDGQHNSFLKPPSISSSSVNENSAVTTYSPGSRGNVELPTKTIGGTASSQPHPAVRSDVEMTWSVLQARETTGSLEPNVAISDAETAEDSDRIEEVPSATAQDSSTKNEQFLIDGKDGAVQTTDTAQGQIPVQHTPLIEQTAPGSAAQTNAEVPESVSLPELRSNAVVHIAKRTNNHTTDKSPSNGYVEVREGSVLTRESDPEDIVTSPEDLVVENQPDSITSKRRRGRPPKSATGGKATPQQMSKATATKTLPSRAAKSQFTQSRLSQPVDRNDQGSLNVEKTNEIESSDTLENDNDRSKQRMSKRKTIGDTGSPAAKRQKSTTHSPENEHQELSTQDSDNEVIVVQEPEDDSLPLKAALQKLGFVSTSTGNSSVASKQSPGPQMPRKRGRPASTFAIKVDAHEEEVGQPAGRTRKRQKTDTDENLVKSKSQAERTSSRRRPLRTRSNLYGNATSRSSSTLVEDLDSHAIVEAEAAGSDPEVALDSSGKGLVDMMEDGEGSLALESIGTPSRVGFAGSIISRLKSIVVDVKTLVLGSSDVAITEELQDLGVAYQQEINAAVRRGRAQG